MAKGNPKHVFDFEGILNMNIDQSHWKDIKKKLEEAFGNLRVAIQEGMAEEEAQKYIDQFNKFFRKAKLPEIGIDDLRENFARLEVSVEQALAALNNISLDQFDEMLHVLKLINNEVEKISKNKGGIKLIDEDNIKSVVDHLEKISNAVAKTMNPFVKSITQIDMAVGRMHSAKRKLSVNDIQEALGAYKKPKELIEHKEEVQYFYDQYKAAKGSPESSWEEEYYWLVKFNKAYDALTKRNQKDPVVIAAMQQFGKVHGQIKGGDADRRNMLQNIINRDSGSDLIGYKEEAWALESTLQEIKSILRDGLSVKIDGGGSIGSGEEVGERLTGGNNADIIKELQGIQRVLTKGIVVSRNDDPDGVKATEKQIDAVIKSFKKQFDKLDPNSKSYKIDREALSTAMDERIMQMFPRRNLNSGDIGEIFDEYKGNPTDGERLRGQIYDIVNKALPKVHAEIDFSELASTLKNIIYKVKMADGAAIEAEEEKKPKGKKKKAQDEQEQPTVSVDADALAQAIGNLNITSDNKDVVAELQKAEQSLGKLVAQEETLNSIKEILAARGVATGTAGLDDEKKRGLIEELDEGYGDDDYYSVADLNRILQSRKQILQYLQQEGQLADDVRIKHEAVNARIEARLSLQKAYAAAERSFEELEGLSHLDADGNNITNADDLQRVLNRRKEIMSSISELAFQDDEYSIFNTGSDNLEQLEKEKQINAELERRVELLIQVRRGSVNVDDVDDLLSETGGLEAKRERLAAIADEFGADVKADEVDEVSEELEEFEKIYDRIIVKLANGKNVTILPDPKGLKNLYKYFDSGEFDAFNGQEIEDIIFERAKVESQKKKRTKETERAQTADAGKSDDAVLGKLTEIASALEKLKIDANNKGVIGEIKALGAQLGALLASEDTLLQIKDAIPKSGTNPADDPLRERLKQGILQAVQHTFKLNTENLGEGSNTEHDIVIYTDGTVSFTTGEDGAVPFNAVMGGRLANVDKSLLVDGHTHPIADDDASAHETFSFSYGDLFYALNQVLPSNIFAMFKGSVVSIVDTTELTNEQMIAFKAALQKKENELINTHPDLFEKSRHGSMQALWQEDPDARERMYSLYHRGISEAAQEVGIDSERFDARYDVTNPAELERLVDVLYDVATKLNRDQSNADRLEQILARMGVLTETKAVQRLLTGYKSGALSIEDVVRDSRIGFSDERVVEVLNSMYSTELSNEPDNRDIRTILDQVIETIKQIDVVTKNDDVVSALKSLGDALTSVLAKNDTVAQIKDILERKDMVEDTLGNGKVNIGLAADYATAYDGYAEAMAKTPDDDLTKKYYAKYKERLLMLIGSDSGALIQELEQKKKQIEERITSVDESVKRVSQMAKLPKEMKTAGVTDLYQEAAKLGQQLSTMYDDGKTDTEEYIALQYKLVKVFDEIADRYGGVKGSGAKNRDELNDWMYDSLREYGGFDIRKSSVIDAWYSGQNAIYGNDGKQKTMRSSAADLLGYNADGFTGALGYTLDLDTLKSVNELLSVLAKRKDDLFGSAEATVEEDSEVTQIINKISEVIEAIRSLPTDVSQKLGNLVAQDETLQNVRTAMETPSVNQDDNAVIEAIKNLSKKLGTKVAQEGTLKAIKDSKSGLIQDEVQHIVKSIDNLVSSLTTNNDASIDAAVVDNDVADAETKELIDQYRHILTILDEWQNVNAQLGALDSENTKELRKNVLAIVQNLSPELVSMIGGTFAENFAKGFKGVKTKDILAPIRHIVGDNMLGNTAEQIEMLKGVDFDNFSLDPLPINETHIDFLQKAFELLQQIDKKKKEMGGTPVPEVQDDGADGEQQPQQQYALEDTLQSVKSILENIQKNTENLNGVEIIRSVDENTGATQQVVDAVTETTGGETSGTPTDPRVDKVTRKAVIGQDGAPIVVGQTQVSSGKTEESYQTIRDQYVPGEDGEFHLVMREIIDDFAKLRKENIRDEKARQRAEKKLNEFLAKFESKTGGNAQYISGFNQLKTDAATEGFITTENIDEVYNRMLELQREYSELEANFRKGQSSLNPFVNAINKSQNIGNIFESVRIKFDGLVERSEELNEQFAKLQELSQKIKEFIDLMSTNPESITPEMFTEFSKNVGEFTATKAQVDGLIKNEAKLNKNITAEQNKRIQEWVKLSKQLGVLDAKINSGLFDDTVVEQAKQERELVLKKIDALLPQINDPSGSLEAVGAANLQSEDKTALEQRTRLIGSLATKYEKLGKLQARMGQAGAEAEKKKFDILQKEIDEEVERLGLNKEQNKALLDALQAHQTMAYTNEQQVVSATKQKRLYSEWLDIYKQIAVLDMQIESSLFDDATKANAKQAKVSLEKRKKAIEESGFNPQQAEIDLADEYADKSKREAELAQRQRLFKELAADYVELGKAEAHVEVKKTEAAKESVRQLTSEIERKTKILQLSKQELDVLAAIQKQSREESVASLDATARDKRARQELQAQKKLSRRQALVGKAGSAIGRADSVWLETTMLDKSVGAMMPRYIQLIEAYEQKLEDIKVLHNTLSTSDGPVTEEDRAELIKQTAELNRMTDQVGALVSEYQRLSGPNAKELGATGLSELSSAEEYKRALTEAVMKATDGKAQIKSFNNETRELTYTLKTGAHETTEFTAATRHLDHQMVALQGTTKRTETFFEATVRKMGEIASYISGMNLISRFTQELRRGIQYIREIDLALTELRKVTDKTEESYDEFLKTASKIGERLGTTISAVTEATSTFAKLGYSMEQATEMAESAIVYKNVGDNIASTEDAANSIISTMKGFGMEASEAMAIVDRFNEIGNSFAVTSQGLGEALRLSASALNEGGNSLDESIGLITAANEVVNDPSSVGKNKLADIKSGYISQNPEVDKT